MFIPNKTYFQIYSITPDFSAKHFSIMIFKINKHFPMIIDFPKFPKRKTQHEVLRR